MRRRGDIAWHNPPQRIVRGCSYCDVAVGDYTLTELNVVIGFARGWRVQARERSERWRRQGAAA